MSEYRIRWIPDWFPWKRAITIWLPFTRFPWMCIPASRKTDPLRLERTKAHEIVHVDQWVRWGKWEFLRRNFSERRLGLEAEAFAGSCAWWFERGYTNVDSGGVLVPVLDHYAGILHDYYGLDVSTAVCKAAISGHLI